MQLSFGKRCVDSTNGVIISEISVRAVGVTKAQRRVSKAMGI